MVFVAYKKRAKTYLLYDVVIIIRSLWSYNWVASSVSVGII